MPRSASPEAGEQTRSSTCFGRAAVFSLRSYHEVMLPNHWYTDNCTATEYESYTGLQSWKCTFRVGLYTVIVGLEQWTSQAEYALSRSNIPSSASRSVDALTSSQEPPSRSKRQQPRAAVQSGVCI